MNPLTYLLGSILLFVGVMIVHEIGHYVRATELGYLSRIGVDKRGLYTEFPDNASSSDAISILSTGVLVGLLFLVLFGYVLVPFALPGLLVAYYLGVRRDLKMISKARACLKERK